ncbi:MAG: hypothetical protein OHK93_006320 [Ramalina farinacea]|uniref:NmrA-like domain-containing protein n=1 Tax=Ramalina farinacea TaxID=258253 RepID=A0AA43QJT6_9LECA|nr:hypothetical protein [Ramalina farinacea]
MPSILVLGAGELGLPVLTALARHPVHTASPSSTPITVLLRPSAITASASSEKKALTAHLRTDLRISLLPGDVAASTTSELAALFQPFDIVISCSGMTYPPGTQLKLAKAVFEANTARERKEAGRGIWYFPWQFGIDYDAIGRGSAQDLFNEQLDVRDLLRAQKEVRWTIVSTGMFMSFLFEEAFGVVSKDWSKVTALGSKENEITVTSVEDIGRMVAEMVMTDELEGERESGIVYTVGATGSLRGLAYGLMKVTGKEVLVEEVPLEVLKEELKEAEEGGNEAEVGLRKYRVVFAEGKGVSWPAESCWGRQRGMEMKGVRPWAEEHYSRR